MAKRRTSDSSATELGKIPRMFRRDIPSDTPDRDATWRRYLADRNPADEEAIIRFYAPLIRYRAYRLMRKDQFRSDDLETLLADGLYSLLLWMRRQESYEPAGLRRWAIGREVNQGMARQTMRRRWPNRNVREKLNAVQDCRARLIQRLERLPSDEELAAALGGLIQNSNIQIGDAPAMLHISQSGEVIDSDGRCMHPEDSLDPVDQGLLGREAMKLATRGMDARERKMFRMIWDGVGMTQIAAEIGTDRRTVYRYVNGLLWRMRCNKKLAAYLGVEPAKNPRVGTRKLPPIASLGPARLVG